MQFYLDKLKWHFMQLGLNWLERMYNKKWWKKCKYKFSTSFRAHLGSWTFQMRLIKERKMIWGRTGHCCQSLEGITLMALARTCSHTTSPKVHDWEPHLSSAQGLELCLCPGWTLDLCLSPGLVHPTLVLSPSAPGWDPNTDPGPASPLCLAWGCWWICTAWAHLNPVFQDSLTFQDWVLVILHDIACRLTTEFPK